MAGENLCDMTIAKVGQVVPSGEVQRVKWQRTNGNDFRVTFTAVIEVHRHSGVFFPTITTTKDSISLLRFSESLLRRRLLRSHPPMFLRRTHISIIKRHINQDLSPSKFSSTSPIFKNAEKIRADQKQKHIRVNEKKTSI